MRTKRHWFSLLAGIFFLACSIFMFANPSAPLTALGIFFSIIVFIGGVLETIRYFFTPASTRSVWSLISAIITVLVGVLLLSASAAAQAAFIPVIVGGVDDYCGPLPPLCWPPRHLLELRGR